MSRQITINGRIINDETLPYVIAEIGHNHSGSLEQCKELFRQAAVMGASAVKLQKRDNETLFTRAMFNSPYTGANSYGPTYGTHRMALEFGEAEYRELKVYADHLAIDFFATPFDIPSADFLERVIDPPCYKIASADLTNTPLLKHVAGFGKPLIISTGGASMDDVHRATDALDDDDVEFALLQCTAAYPASAELLNLRVLQTYRDTYPSTVVGYSGHDDGIQAAVMAYAMGARVIEKHVTLSRAGKGTDHQFSLEQAMLGALIADLKQAHRVLGSAEKVVLPEEAAPITKMAKSLYAARDLPAGHVLTTDDVVIRSPGGGMPPYMLDRVIGQRTTVSIGAEGQLIGMRLEPALQEVGV